MRLLISGERGPGHFPAPVSHLKKRGRIWRWAEVACWAEEHLAEPVLDTDTASFVAALNDALDLRRLAPELRSRGELRALERLLR